MKINFILLSTIYLVVNLYFPNIIMAQTAKSKKTTEMKLTTRLHTIGHFPYSGSLLNKNANIDFNLFYKNKWYGFFVFKAIDLENIHSDINYLQLGLFKSFSKNKFAITFYAGELLLQNNRFFDKGSDIFIAIDPSYKRKLFEIENTTLLTNVLHNGLHSSLANRTEITIPLKTINIIYYLWYNNSLTKNALQSLSTGILIKTKPYYITTQIPIIPSLMFQTYLTNYRPSYAMPNGIVFSITSPIQLYKK